MVRDNTQSKNSKKEQVRRSKRLEELNKKKNSNDDSESNFGSDVDDDNNTINNSSHSETDSDSNDLDVHEYRKFLMKIFPSKNLNKKIKDGEKLKKALNDSHQDTSDEEKEKSPKLTNKKRKLNKKKVIETEEEWETASDSDDEDKCSKKPKNNNKNKKSIKKSVKSESEDEDESESEDEDISDDEDDSKVESNNKFNIIFTIGGGKKDKDEWSSEEDYDSDYEGYEDSDDATEDEDEPVSTDDEDESVNKKSPTKNKQKEMSSKKEMSIKNTNRKIEVCEKPQCEVLEQLKELHAKNPRDKSIKKCIDSYEEDIKKNAAKMQQKEKKHKAKNLRIFRKIVRDKNTMNDFSFYEKLTIPEQKKIIKELREINKITRIEKPYRMTLLESNIPVQFKASAMKKINSLRYMEPGSGEFYKIKNWVDTFMRIPFGKEKGLPISIEDGVDKCHEFMESAQKTLNDAVYGLNDAKMQIMQMLGQLLTNPDAIGTAVAIHGPPGTGKTSLVKEGISKILNRPFAFIALGGATDSSFLEGHSYTYEGSTWGKIVQILIDSQCMNPVIYFDELDKISDTPKGEEIAGILTHLTDTTQNSQFHDKYFAEINFDLSKCLFIFSYNDESKVNPILKDRMYRIKTIGYNGKEKTVISNSYLLPKIREQVKFRSDEIIIPEATMSHIIETHCNKEDGVRNLKRCLEIIYTKLNLYRLMKPESNLFEQDMSLKVQFPFTVTKDIVDKLIKREKDVISSALYSMYI